MHEVPPRPTRPARMRPLAVLPAFFDLRGRRVVVAGGSEAAAWKVELAAAAGAHVEVFAGEPCAELAAIAADPPAGSIKMIPRAWVPEDLAGVAIAIGALDGAPAAVFAAAARALGVPVNIVDTPGLSTFSFGAIVNRSPLVVGISTDGAAPVLGQSIRARIEALLNPALGAWAAAAQRVRARVNAHLPMGAARRQRWQRFAEHALAAHNPPTERDLDALTKPPPARASSGSVALVGAGPGDPELLTLKALRVLQSADVILYDRLVSPQVLELARRESRRVLVGKAAGGERCRQDDINRLMVKLAGEGKRVVRLKGGDPMLFARAAEELDACRVARIPVEVVPGITAALGAAAELQIPLTNRSRARRVQFVTGHSEAGRAPDHDWASLADPEATTAFYMGARTFAAMLPKMLAAGLDPAMPAIAVSAATTPQCARIARPVAQLPAALAGLDPALPCLILLGNGLGHGNVRPTAEHQRKTQFLHRVVDGHDAVRRGVDAIGP